MRRLLEDASGLGDLGNVMVARACKVNKWEHVFVGDRAIYSTLMQPDAYRVGIVRSFVDFGDDFLLCLLTPCFKADVEEGLAEEALAQTRLSCHVPEDHSEWVPATSLHASCIWAPAPNGAERVIAPLWFTPAWAA